MRHQETQKTESARAILSVEQIDVVADRSYFKFEDTEACEQAEMTPYVPKPRRGPAVRQGFFAKDEFRYDPAEDVYICPAGEQISSKYEGKSRDQLKIDDSNRTACRMCVLRLRCTSSFCRVSRLENEAVLDRVAARLKGRPDVLDRRRETVEHPFWLHQAVDGAGLLTKEMENVRA